MDGDPGGAKFFFLVNFKIDQSETTKSHMFSLIDQSKQLTVVSEGKSVNGKIAHSLPAVAYIMPSLIGS